MKMAQINFETMSKNHEELIKNLETQIGQLLRQLASQTWGSRKS